MTSPSHFLVVCEDVSSLPLHCSLSTELSGTLSWPIAIRRFLRESPRTKKSVFFLFFGNYGALCKNKGIWILFRKKCNLQTNSLGKSVPHPQCLGQTQREPHPSTAF